MAVGLFHNLITMLTFRKKQNVVDILEELDKDIKKYEKNKEEIQLNERKYVGALVIYSIFIYLACAILYFAYLMPNNLIDRTKSIVPFLIIPFVVYFIRRFLKWFYYKRVNHYQSKLNIFKEKKKKIIEEVKEKEPYKKAREILDRFSEDEVLEKKISSETKTPPQPLNRTLSQSMLVTPVPNKQQIAQNLNTSIRPNLPFLPPQLASQMIPKTPRPILPQTRSTFDKLIDFFIGEGPSNRYALICKSCYSHNGMALKEEFEYLSFKCAYCGTFNASRKQKLDVPIRASLADLTIAQHQQQHQQDVKTQLTSSSDSETESRDSLKDNEVTTDDIKKSVDEKKND